MTQSLCCSNLIELSHEIFIIRNIHFELRIWIKLWINNIREKKIFFRGKRLLKSVMTTGARKCGGSMIHMELFIASNWFVAGRVFEFAMRFLKLGWKFDFSNFEREKFASKVPFSSFTKFYRSKIWYREN